MIIIYQLMKIQKHIIFPAMNMEEKKEYWEQAQKVAHAANALATYLREYENFDNSNPLIILAQQRTGEKRPSKEAIEAEVPNYSTDHFDLHIKSMEKLVKKKNHSEFQNDVDVWRFLCVMYIRGKGKRYT